MTPYELFAFGFGLGLGVMVAAVLMVCVAEALKWFRARKVNQHDH